MPTQSTTPIGRLRLVEPTEPTPAQATVKRVRAAARRDALVCVCGSTHFVPLVAGPSLVNGRVSGGTKQYACAACWVAGRLVVLA